MDSLRSQLTYVFVNEKKHSELWRKYAVHSWVKSPSCLLHVLFTSSWYIYQALGIRKMNNPPTEFQYVYISVCVQIIG